MSKDVDLRVDSLIRELNRGDYDLIALQEVLLSYLDFNLTFLNQTFKVFFEFPDRFGLKMIF